MGKRIIRILILAGLVLPLVSCGRIQDGKDQKQLIRLFNIPDNAKLVSYRGYPSMVGFGQREGLEISARYRFTDQQLGKFLAAARGSTGWESLPIPAEVKAKIPYKDLKVPLDAQKGVYLCRTAGDNVLAAMKTTSVLAAPRVSDIILGVLNADTNELYVMVKSSY